MAESYDLQINTISDHLWLIYHMNTDFALLLLRHNTVHRLWNKVIIRHQSYTVAIP